MAIDEVVDVVTVRHRVVPAIRAVNVAVRVAVAPMTRRTRSRVGGVNRDRAFVDVVSVHRVQVAIMEIVDVAIVLDGAVAAVRPMNMRVVGVNLVLAHRGRPPDQFVEWESDGREGRVAQPRETDIAGASLVERRAHETYATIYVSR